MESWHKREGLVTRKIAGETIIVPVRGGAADLDRIFTLNEVGTVLWERIDGGAYAAALASAVCSEYEVDEDRAAGDVREFLDALVSFGLIRPAG